MLCLCFCTTVFAPDAVAAAKPKKTTKASKGKKGTAATEEPPEEPEKPAEVTPAAAPQPAPAAPAAPDPAAPPPATPAAAPETGGADLQAPQGRKSKLIPALRVAVYDLELQDVSSSVGVIVTDSLLAEVRKLQGVSAIGMNEIRDMLSHEATKQLAGCSENADSCLADLAGALGVDELITGKLASVGSERLILVRRIDQKRAEVAGTYNQRLKAGSGQEFLATVGPAVEDLFKNYELRGGVTRGVSKEVALRLDPPPIPMGATIGIGVTAVATAIAGGVFSLLALEAQNAYQASANNARDTGVAISGRELTQQGQIATTRATAANVLFGTAGGIAVVAVVMALFTDWKGYRDQLRKREEIVTANN
jgi:hypothetical protein